MRNLLVTPVNMRASIIQLIENEIKLAKKGKAAKDYYQIKFFNRSCTLLGLPIQSG